MRATRAELAAKPNKVIALISVASSERDSLQHHTEPNGGFDSESGSGSSTASIPFTFVLQLEAQAQSLFVRFKLLALILINTSAAKCMIKGKLDCSPLWCHCQD